MSKYELHDVGELTINNQTTPIGKMSMTGTGSQLDEATRYIFIIFLFYSDYTIHIFRYYSYIRVTRYNLQGVPKKSKNY